MLIRDDNGFVVGLINKHGHKLELSKHLVVALCEDARILTVDAINASWKMYEPASIPATIVLQINNWANMFSRSSA